MATAYSTQLTDLDTSGNILDAGMHSVREYVAKAHIALATGDIDDNDIIMMCEVPSNAKIHRILIANDDLDSNCTPALLADLGVYTGKVPHGTYAADAVIDRDCFATAATLGAELQSANTTWVDAVFLTNNITNIDDEVWAVAGLSEDPGVPLRIALTIETAAGTAAAGDLVMVVKYTTK